MATRKADTLFSPAELVSWLLAGQRPAQGSIGFHNCHTSCACTALKPDAKGVDGPGLGKQVSTVKVGAGEQDRGIYDVVEDLGVFSLMMGIFLDGEVHRAKKFGY
ncbi:hypothetical protein F5Y02DRAFT_415605 [Annulohypoxylon stygium]|nr:hypothetical protein F5Y02DRAFT_415605 [Annulohypoxylon stygium]